MSELAIEFDNIIGIIGGQVGGPEKLFAKGNPLHLKVTRQDHGQYALTVSPRTRRAKSRPSSTSG
jgi:hypothetical protein